MQIPAGAGDGDDVIPRWRAGPARQSAFATGDDEQHGGERRGGQTETRHSLFAKGAGQQQRGHRRGTDRRQRNVPARRTWETTRRNLRYAFCRHPRWHTRNQRRQLHRHHGGGAGRAGRNHERVERHRRAQRLSGGGKRDYIVKCAANWRNGYGDGDQAPCARGNGVCGAVTPKAGISVTDKPAEVEVANNALPE